MAVDVILGLQWGDEGKGKIVDVLASNYDIVARFQGGPNAGHTLKFDGKKFVLHTIPSGIFRDDLQNLIGNGVVIDPVILQRELNGLKEAEVDYKGRLFVARKAHLILPTHCLLDAASEAAKGKAKIGSTLKGIGPTYMDKTGRNGLRVGDIESPDFMKRYQTLRDKHLNLAKMYPEIEFDLQEREKAWFEAINLFKTLEIVDGEYFLNEALDRGDQILAEGAQGSMLDVDYGTYPFVTSSNTITSGVCTGLGIAPSRIREVIGITKAYCTRVGSGPFPSELNDETGEMLRKEGMEFGATTGRPRRCGWIDIPQLKYTIMLNGVTQLTITKIDVLNIFDEIKAATTYLIGDITTDQVPFDLSRSDLQVAFETFPGWQSDLDGVTTFEALPETMKTYLARLEDLLGVPITMISTGPERKKLIHKTVNV
ncbi:MAG: adenylosuccinate synthase [Bacteroidota bacterium]